MSEIVEELQGNLYEIDKEEEKEKRNHLRSVASLSTVEPRPLGAQVCSVNP